MHYLLECNHTIIIKTAALVKDVTFLCTRYFSKHAVRWFLAGLVLVLTIGKVHFWIFPNLENEKLGFIDSFFPLYSVETSSGDAEKAAKKKRKKKGMSAGEEGEGRKPAKVSDEEDSGKGDDDRGKEEEGGGESQESTHEEDTRQQDAPTETLKA